MISLVLASPYLAWRVGFVRASGVNLLCDNQRHLPGLRNSAGSQCRRQSPVRGWWSSKFSSKRRGGNGDKYSIHAVVAVKEGIAR